MVVLVRVSIAIYHWMWRIPSKALSLSVYWKHQVIIWRLLHKQKLLKFQGQAYNGECVDLEGLLDTYGVGKYIFVYEKEFRYDDAHNNTHIHDCADFCNMKLVFWYNGYES